MDTYLSGNVFDSSHQRRKRTLMVKRERSSSHWQQQRDADQLQRRHAQKKKNERKSERWHVPREKKEKVSKEGLKAKRKNVVVIAERVFFLQRERQ